MLRLSKSCLSAILMLISGFVIVHSTPVLAQEFPNFPVGTENSSIEMLDSGALVPAAPNSLYPNALQLVYIDGNQDLDLAYTTDGIHYVEVGPIYYNGNFINPSCSPAYADHCSPGAAWVNGVLYVAYPGNTCNCLHVIAGTPEPGTMVFNWSYVFNNTTYQLSSAPVVADLGGNVVIRFGTTNQNSAYSAVLPSGSTVWQIYADNGYAATQGTIFTLNGKNICIEKQNNSDNGVFWAQVDDNGVDVPGTGGQISGWYANSGFSTTIYNGYAIVSSRVNNSSNDLQIWASSDGVTWSGKTYTNNQAGGDFALATYNNQGSAGVAMVYRCNCPTPVLFGNWAQ